MDKKLIENRTCLGCQAKSPLFKLLSDKELELVDQNRTSVFFKKGETIRKQGAVLTHVISLNSGLTKAYLEGPNNKNIILAFASPTSFIGGPGMFVDHKHHFTVTAIMDSCVCYITLGIFKELLQKNTLFADEYFKHLSNITLSSYNRLINLTQKKMDGRLADALLYLSDEIFKKKRFELQLSNKDLAELSGMSKDNVVKNVKKFQQEGLINNSGNEIEILDYNTLQQISRIG